MPNECSVKRSLSGRVTMKKIAPLLYRQWWVVLGLATLPLSTQAAPSSVTVQSANATVSSASPTTMTFPLTRSGDATYDTWVQYQTRDGSALSGSDYTATNRAAKVGATQTNISVQILGASIQKPDKQFTLELLGAAGVGPTPDFASQLAFATKTSPYMDVAADVNGDGKLDLIVANRSSASVSVLINTTTPGAATPTFAAQQTFATGSLPESVAAADVNGDGKPDLVVVNSGDDTVSVLLNNTGTGAAAPTFAAQQTFTTGNAPTFVAAADVNGDGRPDLLVANAGGNSVSMLLNTTAPGAATPTFAAQQTFATGSSPVSVAAADVNGDGKRDLIVANNGDNTVSVLLNTTAQGATTVTFAAQQPFATGSAPVCVALTDVNGDGKVDLITANSGGNSVAVLVNTTAPGASTPAFAAQQPFASGSSPSFVATADVNGDGKPDLIAVNKGGGTVSVLFNTTSPGVERAAFAPQQSFATGTDPRSVTLADVNGDGWPDVLVANSGDNTLSVLLNTTVSPTAVAPSFDGQQLYAAGNTPESVAAADLNGDGRPDLIVANSSDDTVSVLLNTTPPGAPTPTFAAQQIFATGATGSSPEFVAAADVNGDGRPDLIVANAGNNTVSLLLNSTSPGSATSDFAAPQTFVTGSGPFSIAVTDVNGDGKADLIVSVVNDNIVTVMLGVTGGQRNFATGSGPFSVAAADVNGDGRPDLIVGNALSDSVSVLLNTTAPGATLPAFAAQQTFATGTSPRSVTATDMNGDGKPDLLIADLGGDTVSVLIDTTAPGAAKAAFAAQQTFATGASPFSVAAADLNGDGRRDLLVANQADNTVSVLLNTTSPGAVATTFAAQQSFATGAAPRSVTTADVNGDGQPDLIVANHGDANVSVLLDTQYVTSVSPASVTGTIHFTIPVAALSPNPLDFGNQIWGTSMSKTITLTNSGGADLTLGSIAISGTDAAQFGQTNTCPTTLGTGASCPVSVTYTPTALAAANAMLIVNSNASSSPDSVPLTGTGTDTAPSATDGSVSTAAGQAVTGQLGASDADAGQTLTYAVVTQPTHGSVTVKASTGAFTYTPDASFSGSDAFTFTVNDGVQDSNTATESVTVNSAGGGGILGWAGLLVLTMLSMLRWWQRKRMLCRVR